MKRFLYIFSFIILTKFLFATDSDFIFGINGHPVSANGTYSRGAIDTQLDILDNHSIGCYRVDVRFYTTDSKEIKILHEERLNELVEKAVLKDIEILPILPRFLFKLGDDPSKAFDIGKKLGVFFTTKFKGKFKYIELPNEMDARILNRIDKYNGSDGVPNGSKISHFTGDYSKIFRKSGMDSGLEGLSKYLHGLHLGIKSVDPNIKTIISSSGWLHYKFFQALYHEDTHPNFPDIIGWHWYSDMGDLNYAKDVSNTSVLDKLEKYEKDIWITEINRRHGTYNLNESNVENEYINWLVRNLDQVLNRDSVKAFFIYELFDEPWSKAISERYYGLYEWIDVEYDGVKSTSENHPDNFAFRSNSKGPQIKSSTISLLAQLQLMLIEHDN